jgi:hypothetical protein
MSWAFYHAIMKPMTEGKLECSCAEQMELAALFSADLIGPLANSLDARNLVAMHRNAGTELAIFGSSASDHRHDYMHPRHASRIVSVMESRSYET